MADPGFSVDSSLAGIQNAGMQAQVDATQATLSQGGGSSGSTGTMTASNMDELKNNYPQLYNAIVQSMAQQMCTVSQHANERVIEEMKKQREDGF